MRPLLAAALAASLALAACGPETRGGPTASAQAQAAPSGGGAAADYDPDTLTLRHVPADTVLADPEVAQAIALIKDGRSGEAATLLKGAVERGNALAARMLSELLGVQDRDGPIRAGCDYAERAMIGGLATGAHNLAVCHEFGRGRPRDVGLAHKLYAAAARGGSLQSQCAVGIMLIKGRGVAQDRERGFEMCRAAAEAGDANAQADVGWHYLGMHEHPRDDARARDYLERAVAQDHANAAVSLGVMLMLGKGGAPDVARGQALFDGASERSVRKTSRSLCPVFFSRIGSYGEPKSLGGGRLSLPREQVTDMVAARLLCARAAELERDPARREKFGEMTEVVSDLLETLGPDAVERAMGR